jgi:Zn-dependent protease with chaperone function
VSSAYVFRLLWLCLASFFVLNAALVLIVRIFSGSALRMADTMQPRAAARFLLALRLLPSALSALFVTSLCVPSYLWLEPAGAVERVGALCAALGLIGAATWTLTLARSIRAVVSSLRYHSSAGSAGQETSILEKTSAAKIVEEEGPVLAMSGLFHPRLFISRGILRVLSADELDAALAHEDAHRISRDNAKRFLLLLAPDIFPFLRPLRALERNWAKFTEWAADDQATAGDSRRALSLAAALVHVARLDAAPRLPILSTSLLGCDRDLSARVNRLLRIAPSAPARTRRYQVMLRMGGLLLAFGYVVLLTSPATLFSVHELLERFLR